MEYHVKHISKQSPSTKPSYLPRPCIKSVYISTLIAIPIFQGVLWNFACVMSMIGLTIIILGLALVIPAMMKVVPISVIQQSQGRLSLYIIQTVCEILTVLVK